MAAGFICPVCDYPKLSESPRSEFGGGSFEICPSCGFQFGVNDDAEGISYETWRRRWETAGMPWTSVALDQPSFWQPVAKYVAPGGAALRRPGDAPAPDAADENPTAPDPEPETGMAVRTKKTADPQTAAPRANKKTAVRTVASAKKPAKAAKAAKPAKPANTAKALGTKKPASKNAARAKNSARR